MACDFIDDRSARRSSTAEHEIAEGLNAMFMPFTIDLDWKITTGRMNEQIHVETFAIYNIGDSLFADTELPAPDRTGPDRLYQSRLLYAHGIFSSSGARCSPGSDG